MRIKKLLAAVAAAAVLVGTPVVSFAGDGNCRLNSHGVYVGCPQHKKK